MDIINIYYINGYINSFGDYEKRDDYITLIAECRRNNDSGFSYYSFMNIDTVNDIRINANLVRLENLMSLIENPNIYVIKMSEDEFLKSKEYFMVILENAKIYEESKKMKV